MVRTHLPPPDRGGIALVNRGSGGGIRGPVTLPDALNLALATTIHTNRWGDQLGKVLPVDWVVKGPDNDEADGHEIRSPVRNLKVLGLNEPRARS